MSKHKLIVFGTAEMAEMASFYFSNDSSHEVVGFTVDDEYVSESMFQNKPVIPFSEIKKKFDPKIYKMHVALSYKNMNEIREKKFHEVKDEGFELASYICSKIAMWPDLSYGENCFVLENQTLQPGVKLGDNVMLWSGNHIGHKSKIGHHTYLSSHVVVSGHCNIGKRCFFGVNSTIRDFINIGDDVLVGMNASVTKDVGKGEVVIASSSDILKCTDRRAIFLKNRI